VRSFKSFFNEKTDLEPNELRVGDKVSNCNPECKHFKSSGIVKKVIKIKGKKGNVVGNKVKYRCTNDGENYNKGEELEKTEIQLKKV
jgi:hypothetical protein